jgi:hypothetical protein
VLMERCWADSPDDRPTFEMIRSIIRCIRKWVTKSHIAITNYLAGLYTELFCVLSLFEANTSKNDRRQAVFSAIMHDFSSDPNYILENFGFSYGILWPFNRRLNTEANPKRLG